MIAGGYGGAKLSSTSRGWWVLKRGHRILDVPKVNLLRPISEGKGLHFIYAVAWRLIDRESVMSSQRVNIMDIRILSSGELYRYPRHKETA